MNKYRDKSDFEINKEVVKLIKTKGGYSCVDHDEIVKVYVSQNTGIYKEFDPCNDPYDAMPIIKDNLISLEHDGIAWTVSCVRHPEISVWDGCENYNDNFYRKAMELFLLMKDAENEK